MKKIFLIVITATFILFASQCFAQQNNEEEELFPEAFLNTKEASQQNCKIVNLKGTSQKNCVLQKFKDHELYLAIYDPEKDGKLLKSQKICFPSWNWKAKVKYLNLLGEAQQFMSITFEGNTGTGTLQMIEMITGWHNGKFVPVFVETVDYGLMEEPDVASLKMSYEIRNKASSNITLLLKYTLTGENLGDSKYKFKTTWQDKLKWNKETFSFYNAAEESKKDWFHRNSFLPYIVQRKISKVRDSIKDVAINNLCKSFFDRTKIMNILYSE